MKKPLTVYLDSSDYSNLSQKNDTKYRDCLTELKSFSASGHVDYVFSMYVVSEMAPLTIQSIDMAKKRIKLMNELCSYSLIDFKQLAEAEINNLQKNKSIHVLKRKELWISESIVPLEKLKLKIVNKREMDEFNKIAYQHSVDNKAPLLVSVISLAQKLGLLKGQKVESILLSEMRNINFLLDMIDYRFEFSLQLSKIVRESSANFYGSINEIINDYPLLSFSGDEWISNANEFLMKFIQEMYKNARPNLAFSYSVDEVMRTCPGISMGIMSGRLALQDSFAVKNHRSIKESDLVDSMHAIYVPYVDIFRSDKYMSRHITKAGGSNVISNLLDLPDEIRRRL